MPDQLNAPINQNTPENPSQEPEPFEQMYRTLYDYYFRKISFLDLLQKWEELLDLPSPTLPLGNRL